MPKKTGIGDYYNFIFFLNHVLRKSERILEKHYRENPNIFHW